LPVRKCINVMVGIIRSEVILCFKTRTSPSILRSATGPCQAPWAFADPSAASAFWAPKRPSAGWPLVSPYRHRLSGCRVDWNMLGHSWTFFPKQTMQTRWSYKGKGGWNHETKGGSSATASWWIASSMVANPVVVYIYILYIHMHMHINIHII
jgi:hypothetical protein